MMGYCMNPDYDASHTPGNNSFGVVKKWKEREREEKSFPFEKKIFKAFFLSTSHTQKYLFTDEESPPSLFMTESPDVSLGGVVEGFQVLISPTFYV